MTRTGLCAEAGRSQQHLRLVAPGHHTGELQIQRAQHAECLRLFQ
jgi:hypothetical protein